MNTHVLLITTELSETVFLTLQLNLIVAVASGIFTEFPLSVISSGSLSSLMVHFA